MQCLHQVFTKNVVIDTTLHKILIVSTWSSYSSRPMYEGSTWHILGRLKIRGIEKVWKETKFWTMSVNFGDFWHNFKLERHIDTCSWRAGYGTCAVIKDLSGYQQSNPVSSVAAPAVAYAPKNRKIPGKFPYWVADSSEILLFSHFC